MLFLLIPNRSQLETFFGALTKIGIKYFFVNFDCTKDQVVNHLMTMFRKRF